MRKHLFRGLAFLLCVNASIVAKSEELDSSDPKHPLYWDYSAPKVLFQVLAKDIETDQVQTCSYLIQLQKKKLPDYCGELQRIGAEPTCRTIYESNGTKPTPLHPNFIFEKDVARDLKTTLEKKLKESKAIEGNPVLDYWLGSIALAAGSSVYGGAYFGPIGVAVVGGLIIGSATIGAIGKLAYEDTMVRWGKFPNPVLSTRSLELTNSAVDLLPSPADPNIPVSPMSKVEIESYKEVFNKFSEGEIACPEL